MAAVGSCLYTSTITVLEFLWRIATGNYIAAICTDTHDATYALATVRAIRVASNLSVAENHSQRNEKQQRKS